MQIFVYGLRASDSEIYRYFGATTSPAVRLTGHHSGREPSTGDWVLSLSKKQIGIEMDIIGIFYNDADATAFERELIRRAGPSALNLQTEGGRGAPKRRLPSNDCLARGLLYEFLCKSRITYRDAADCLGTISHVAVFHWVVGTRRPSAHMRKAIECWTNGAVPASSWLTRGERTAPTVTSQAEVS